MKSLDECTPDSSYELYDSPYVEFRGDMIYYEYDDMVRFVFKAFFSAMKLAAMHLAMPIVRDECHEKKQDSPIIILRRVEQTANQYLLETMHHGYICEALYYHLSALLVQTYEMLDAEEKCGGDIEKLHIDRIMDNSGFEDCVTDALRYYHFMFEDDLLPSSSEELKLIKPTTTHYTIDYPYLVTTLCGIVIYTYFDIFKIYPLYSPLHDEVKDALCACIFPILAELHYEAEDLDYIQEILNNAKHSNKYKMELACRYPQVAEVAIKYIEECYSEALKEGKSKEMEKFFSDYDPESLMESYLQELREERAKRINAQNKLDEMIKLSAPFVRYLKNMEGFADIMSICENQHQQVRDKYQHHFLVKYAHDEYKDKVLHLLEKLEKFRVEGKNINGVLDKYEFDLSKWQKKQIFAVCKDIRSCLSIGKNAFGQYLLDNTNLGNDTNTPNKSITLNTILNQI